MYPNQAGQWSPQPPPNNGQFAPRPPNPQQQQQQNAQIPPISQALPQGTPSMQTLQPQHDPYRSLPPPQAMYPYHQPPQMPYPPTQPAPRQRTAIACRYCRRRKIRCSGFDQSEDGRCTNCQRFSQECVFTPVSAQTQAFVPAHTVWRGQQPPANTQLYGAYGQPLPPHGRGEQQQQQYPPQGQPQQQQQQQPGQYPPPPQGYQQQPPMYGGQQQPSPGGTPGGGGGGDVAGRKRPTDEPHTPTLPPPNPATQGPRGSEVPGYGYPDPMGENGIPGAAMDRSGPTQFPNEVRDVGVQTDDFLLQGLRDKISALPA